MLVLAGSASAEIRPSFNLHSCAWKATDIVVVTEGNAIDGEVMVLETWKGELRHGEQLTIPELATFATEESRKVAEPWLPRDDDDVPKKVTGDRMVLFLIRENDQWLPADKDSKEMAVSTVWIENDHTMAIFQQMNPGPSELVSMDMGEEQLRKTIDYFIDRQKKINDAIAWNDAERLASAIPFLYRMENADAQRFMIEALGDAGPSAVPALLTILGDESDENVIHALRKAGGADIAPKLTELLTQDLAFWKTAGPSLKPGWWNSDGLTTEQQYQLRLRYGRTYATLTALRDLRFAGAEETVAALRDFWRSLPQLGDIGNDQIGRECDVVLYELPR